MLVECITSERVYLWWNLCVLYLLATQVFVVMFVWCLSSAKNAWMKTEWQFIMRIKLPCNNMPVWGERSIYIFTPFSVNFVASQSGWLCQWIDYGATSCLWRNACIVLSGIVLSCAFCLSSGFVDLIMSCKLCQSSVILVLVSLTGLRHVRFVRVAVSGTRLPHLHFVRVKVSGTGLHYACDNSTSCTFCQSSGFCDKSTSCTFRESSGFCDNSTSCTFCHGSGFCDNSTSCTFRQNSGFRDRITSRKLMRGQLQGCCRHAGLISFSHGLFLRSFTHSPTEITRVASLMN